jgi:hypothetical protein
MSFKIRDGLKIGIVDVFNSSGVLQVNAPTATKLASTFSITASGDASWTVSPDGSGAVTAALTLATVCATPGTYSSCVVNAKGLVTSGSNPGYLTTESDTLSTVTGRGATTPTALSITNTTSSTTTATGCLILSGGLGINENLNVGGNTIITGNLTVNGSTNTINSTTMVVEDPIINLGGGLNGAAPTIDDAKDRGVEFQWYDSQARTGFFGFNRSTGYFTFIPLASFANEVVSGTIGDIAATNFRGSLIGNADTATKTATARAISISGDMTWTVDFDGSVPATAAGTLATVCATPGTYSSCVVNAKGLVTSGSNPGYLTAEVDTLSTVTGRGATTPTALTFTNTTDTTSISTGSMIFSGGIAVNKNILTPANILTTASDGTLIGTTNSAYLTLSTISTIPVDTWAVATYRSAKYLIQITQGINHQCSEIIMIQNGITTSMTEYGVLETDTVLATFTSDVAAGSARLLVTMGSNASATIKIMRDLITI